MAKKLPKKTKTKPVKRVTANKTVVSKKAKQPINKIITKKTKFPTKAASSTKATSESKKAKKSINKIAAKKTQLPEKTASSAKVTFESKKSLIANQKAQWEAYKNLQARVDAAWDTLQADVKRKAKAEILVQDKNHLLLLLGECNYMASECMRLEAKKQK